MNAWESFVFEHGGRALAYELAIVLGQSQQDVERVRLTGACRKQTQSKRFTELFTLWNGRAPRDDEWPRPRRVGVRGTYEWQGPELALLASLVGPMSTAKIAGVLTKRLRLVTHDRAAVRTAVSVQVRINKIGMTSSDVVGGITLAAAGRELGSYAPVYQAIRDGRLASRRVGTRLVIPHAAWDAYKAARTLPPRGYVPLARIRIPLGINSDAKLPEWASLGYIPTAVRCNPCGTDARNSRFGTWYIDARVAKKLVSDRRAGRPMPWHGKPTPDNLKATWKLLVERRHPGSCPSCRTIWGKAGAPADFEDYAKRYPPLDFGAKRHLTRKWTPGLTLLEVAKLTGASLSMVQSAIAHGTLNANGTGKPIFVSRSDATYWKTRRCPTGNSESSWISLATASLHYYFTRAELRRHIDAGRLQTKVPAIGSAKGLTCVPRHQCARLRATLGFTEDEAAKRAGVSIARMRVLMQGATWRAGERIPLETVKTIIKRVQSREGYTIEQAAVAVRSTVEWVNDRILDGTVRVCRAKWDRRRRYITAPMLQRLKEAKRHPVKRSVLNADWLLIGQAAVEAGVSIGTVTKWFRAGELRRLRSTRGWRYHRKSIRSRARLYWKSVRFHRAVPPVWLRKERDADPS